MEDLEKINQKLKEILNPEKGYFGRIRTLKKSPSEYKYIGYELTEDFLPTLQKMSREQKNNLITIIYYFEIHANPLKRLLEIKQEEKHNQFYSDVAWSHFMTVVMFGMLEVAVRIQPDSKINKSGHLKDKGNKIKKFLEKYLSGDVRDDMVKRYCIDDLFGNKKPENFNEVVDHLWEKIRCNFVHNAGLESTGLEWYTLEGTGAGKDPITLKSNVPVQEWLQRTWQTILNSYGYTGLVKLPKNRK